MLLAEGFMSIITVYCVCVISILTLYKFITLHAKQ